MAKGIRDKVAIIGMGCSRFGERWDCGPEELMLESYTEALADAGIEWILATGIERDGMMTGPDTNLLDEVRSVVPAVKLIASGGVATLDHIEDLASAGYEAVITGRALYEGRFSLNQAIAAATL